MIFLCFVCFLCSLLVIPASSSIYYVYFYSPCTIGFLNRKKQQRYWPTILRVFQIVLRVGGNPPSGEGIENFAGGIFLSGGGNLRRSNFDDLNLFQSQKQLSINTEHQLKSKLAWPTHTKSMKLKQKWYRSNDYS